MLERKNTASRKSSKGGVKIGDNSEHFPDNPKRGETVTILVNSSEIPQIGEDRVITFRATGLSNRMWEISKNQPANKQTLGKCANVNYESENDVGGSMEGIQEHKHRRK